ncbi:YeeE/YedE thiosulfate transporter family protein [Desulfitobacterium sp.]|uniref:YeeE/YedE thiosulfate transporter family protein n=1 Tax=Desulfitobacterium sp. TaxID=49981 RepID=UPI002D7ED3BA|nr:YeeE/YedE thiosulfate transporter family protein [Desulfitobacterium sp.]
MKMLWKDFYHGPWPYWVGAVVLAFLNIIILYVRQSPWGVTANIEEWAILLGGKVGIVSESQFTLTELMSSSGTYLNLGVVLGALWSTLVASQGRFRPIRQKKFVFSALIGGILMGYGARIAYGCNIGGLLNGIASSSLTGWIFAGAVLLGTYIGTKILIRFLV